MNRKVVLLLMVVIAVMVLLLWWNHRHLSKAEQELVVIATNQPSASSVSLDKTNPKTSKDEGSPQPASNQPPPRTITVEEYVKRSMEDPQYDWKQPINFCGRVVDESNVPVAGATASFEWTDLSPTGTSQNSTTSDGQGFFSLINRKGKRLIVEVSKNGYYSSGNSRGAAFEYANPADGLFTPDSNRPVVFHLRKKGEGADLIHGLKLFGSRIDGTLSYVNLQESKNSLNPPGDLTVRFTRSEKNAEKKFDWTFTLGVVDGGLIESTNEFMFLAPENGYQSTFEISHQADDPDWVLQEKHKFYIKSQDGRHYARIEITIIPDYGKNAAYDLNWDLNPNGSRNLEPR